MLKGKLMKKSMKAVRLFFILICSFCMTAACGTRAKPYTKSGIYFDTIIQITLYEPDKEALIEECFSMAQEYEALFSPSVEGSDLWNINHGEGKSVEISKETYDLLKEAFFYAELTEGRIDPTTLPLSRLWGFYTEDRNADTVNPADGSDHTSDSNTVPSAREIKDCLTYVDYQKLILSEDHNRYTALLPDPEMQIDLGFIAKGYIADRMKEYLISQGTESGIINLGGNILTIGTKPDGTNYDIGIKPLDENGNPITVLSIADQSVVTSGIYERCFEYEGESYHHILDAETGYPVDNELYGVTVISDSSLQGDALSTTCLILGLEEGKKLIENTASCEAVFITKDKKIYKTDGL